jgi:hypothetical protein
MNVVMVACPCAEAALSRGLMSAVIESITTHRMTASDVVYD